MIAFDGNKRLIGVAASNQKLSNIDNTFHGFKHSLGKCGEFKYQAKYMNEKHSFAPEQLFIMLLKKLKSDAETVLGEKVENCVLTVPSYFTYNEKQSLIDAATIAELKCFGVLTDTAAIAFDFGYYRLQELAKSPKRKNKDNIMSSNHFFIDFGNSSIQASAVSFYEGKFTILATTSALKGGRDITKIIADELCDDIKKRYKYDPRSDRKSFATMLFEAEKIKKQISFKDDSIHIDTLFEDVAVSFTYDRNRLEENSKFKEMMGEVRQTFDQCHSKTKLNACCYDYESIEIVGGSSRIPFFQKLVENFFRKLPSIRLNPEESVARGGAIYCAMLQPKIIIIENSLQLKFENADDLKIIIEYKTEPETSRTLYARRGKCHIHLSYWQLLNMSKCYFARNNIKMSDDWISEYI